jgi:hypothetical protein
MKNGVIPAIFRIDIEPNEHLQPEAGDDMQEWSGFVDTVEMVETLRGPLADIAGAAFNPNWFVRFDPEIERRYGRADAAFFLHREQFDKLAARQDPIGIHVHLHRWDCEKNVTFSDYGSSAWANYCLEFSSDVYAKCFDQPVRRTSQGGYFISEDIINTLVKLGIEADISLEPGLPAKMSDISIGEYASAPSTDFKAYQRTPYFPSTSNMAVPCKSELDKRPILLVPLTSYDYSYALSTWYNKLAKSILRRPRSYLPLSPWKEWPSPEVYWNLVSKALGEMEKPYFAFAMRTDNPNAYTFKQTKALLEHLPKHPIAKKLHFVDVLDDSIAKLI